MRKGLKKIRKSIRGKSGKASMRSYWVKPQAQKLKRGSVLASFNHPGPNAGSDHSWFAHLVGVGRSRALAAADRSAEFGSLGSAGIRQVAGANASWYAQTRPNDLKVGVYAPATRDNGSIRYTRDNLAAAFDVPRSDVTYRGRGRK